MPKPRRKPIFYSHCVVCRKLQPYAGTGRPRVTCSDACRQKRYRRHHEQEREWAADDRRAERIVRKWEKRYGSFDYPDDPDYPDLTLRWRLKFRLTRYMPVPECPVCGKPFIPQMGSGKPLHHCSRACREKDAEREKAVRESLATQPERAHPLTEIHMRVGKCRACAHCGAVFPIYHVNKKYCGDACRQAAWRKRHPRRTCPECRRRFYARAERGARGAGGRPHVYCGRACYLRAYDREHPRAERGKKPQPRYLQEAVSS